MQIDVSNQTIRDIQMVLANRGDSAGVTAYVDRALQRALFFDTAREIKRQNKGVVDPAELDKLIDEAVEASRQP